MIKQSLEEMRHTIEADLASRLGLVAAVGRSSDV
jgi:hypothetical protein